MVDDIYHNPLMKRYVWIAIRGKKRMKKKAWNLVVKWCGYDGQGLVNYAKVANLMTRMKVKM
jgi:hypothetical protein